MFFIAFCFFSCTCSLFCSSMVLRGIFGVGLGVDCESQWIQRSMMAVIRSTGTQHTASGETKGQTNVIQFSLIFSHPSRTKPCERVEEERAGGNEEPSVQVAVLELRLRGNAINSWNRLSVPVSLVFTDHRLAESWSEQSRKRESRNIRQTTIATTTKTTTTQHLINGKKRKYTNGPDK